MHSANLSLVLAGAAAGGLCREVSSSRLIRRSWRGRPVAWSSLHPGSCVGSAYVGGQPRLRRRAQFEVPGLVAVDLAQPVSAPWSDSHATRQRRARCRPRPPTRAQTGRGGHPARRLRFRAVLRDRLAEEALPGTSGNASRCRRRTRPRRPRHPSPPGAAHRGGRVEVRHGRDLVVEDGRAVGDGARPRRARRGAHREGTAGRGRRGEDASDRARTTAMAAIDDRGSLVVLVAEVTPPVERDVVLPARMWFSIRRRYAPAR